MKYLILVFITIIGFSACSSKKIEHKTSAYQHNTEKEKEAFKALDKELAK